VFLNETIILTKT